MKVNGYGTIPSDVMLIGDFPSTHDEASGHPFDGYAGRELDRMLHEAGILRGNCYTTLAVKERPPENNPSHWIAKAKKDITAEHSLFQDRYVKRPVVEGAAELLREIELVNPKMIITFGCLPLGMLTGNWSSSKWRGSQLMLGERRLIPTLHPTVIMKQWEMRGLAVTDLRRAARFMHERGPYPNIPVWNFTVRPSFGHVIQCLQSLIVKLEGEELWFDLDIETRYNHIDCIGFSWNQKDALCIPFISAQLCEGYWSAEEEGRIIYLLYRMLTHRNARIRWQNGLYDAQHIYRHWHFVPRGVQDTMISQHSCFAALPKGLAILASMYSDYYVYWKDEGKIASNAPEERRWRYNLQDCYYTRTSGEVLSQTVKTLKLEAVEAQQQELFYPVLRAMQIGFKVDVKKREEMAMEVQEALSSREAFLYRILGHELNVSSPKQMKELFYEDLKQPPVWKRSIVNGRTKMSPTCDDEALTKIAIKEPILKPLCNAIADIRTLNKFYKDFIMMPLDSDGRMRCSFNIAGDAGSSNKEVVGGVKSAPYTYRLSSSENAFGTGGNLQTIPSDKSKSAGKAAARGSLDFKLPNIRSMFVPDDGYTCFDMDLDRADLQIVVRESGEKDWIAAMDAGVDMHLLNVYALDNQEPPPLDELVESHPRYMEHRQPRKHKREFAKVFCHGTNYLGKAKTMAAHTGRNERDIERAQAHWFHIHPGIKKWHQRVIDQVTKYRFIENRFGYRWYIFDRIDDNTMPAAVAWIPQSTVGILINKIWCAWYRDVRETQVLIQVHDSLVGQFPTHRKAELVAKMYEASKIVIPYEHPLIIPTGIKTSTTSWGDCK